MKYSFMIILFTSVYITTFAQKQNHLVLQNKKNHNRFKELSLNEFYKIRLFDTIISTKIISFTDSTLSIVNNVRTNHDTSYTLGKSGGNKVPGKKYYEDTLIIKFSDVQYVKVAWFKKRDFAVLPAYLGFASTVGIPLIIIGSLIDSGEVDLESLAAVASISVISWTLLFIATRERKYDTQKKWILTLRE
jgi:hypothetical protein